MLEIKKIMGEEMMRKLLATISLMAVLMVSSVFAEGGLILGDLAGGDQQNPCVENQKGKGWINSDYGIIIVGFTGIIIVGFSEDTTVTNCGIILSD